MKNYIDFNSQFIEMTIHYPSPFAQDLNIGAEYNTRIAELSDGWIVLRDHDTLLFPNSGNIIPKIIEANPEFELFTALTNRVGVHLHCVEGMFNEDSILAHQDKAAEHWERFGTQVMETGIAPGFCMMFTKSLWGRIGGFPEHSITFDREFSYKAKKVGARIGLALGLYIFHLYRYPHIDAKNYTNHLLK